MARKTAESANVEPHSDSDIHASDTPIGGREVPDGPDLTVNWFELFPAENNSETSDVPATSPNPFYVASSSTASDIRGDALPRKSFVPRLFVDERKPGATLVPPASTTTRLIVRRRPMSRQFMKWLDAKELRWGTWLDTTARRWATWLTTTPRRLAAFTHDTRNWMTARSGAVVGILVCLVLILPSIPYRSIAVNPTADSDEPASPLPSPVAVLSASSSPVSEVATEPAPPPARPSANAKHSARIVSPRVDVIVGKLVVSSDPAGAAVFLNQRFVGRTPLETSVKAGSYAVVIEHEATRWTDVVLVRGDRVTRVERQLQASRR